MDIMLEKAGKRFQTDWIFRNVTFTFSTGHSYAILGRNGSGKSTFLQILAGNYQPTAGTVRYVQNGNDVPVEQVFRYLALSAPYQEVIEEFTLPEMLGFHFSFKNLLPGYTIPAIIELLGFGNQLHKPLRQFSSGMRQRVKLALALLSDTPLLLLDEPTVNLDQAGTDWYLNLIHILPKDRLIIVCSNLEHQETGFCSGRLFIEDFK